MNADALALSQQLADSLNAKDAPPAPQNRGLKAGAHVGISAEAYHADALTHAITLSRSGICTLLKSTPAHFAAQHPRLSKFAIERDSTEATGLGEIVHAIVLGEGAKFCVIEPSQFLNKDGSPAKTFGNAEAARAKADAEERGLIVLNEATSKRAQAIAQRLTDKLRQRFPEWDEGDSEVTLLWQRRVNDGSTIWCRGRVDRLVMAHEIDLKTTSRALSDAEIARMIATEGLDLQAAWYLDGLQAIHPNLAGRATFTFAFAETAPPYSIRFVELPESWLTMARVRIDRAAQMFGDCLRSGVWPEWPDVVVIEPPSWYVAQCEASFLAEEAF